MRQWAIVVGLNHYQHIQPLSCAQQDAQTVHQYLVDELGFQAERCLLLTDSSPGVWGKPTQPTRVNLLSWIELLAKSYLHPDDLFWFFFSGYGIVHEGKDYLMPLDGNPAAISSTCIPISAILQRIKSVLSDGSMLCLLDMSRSQGLVSSSQSVGMQTAQTAHQMEVPTILSAQPGQFSREVSSLGHGLFTVALLEGLRYQPGTTIAALTQFLGDRLPELCQHYWQPIHKPLLICPVEQVHQPVLPEALDDKAETILNESPATVLQETWGSEIRSTAATPAVVTMAAPANSTSLPQISRYTTIPAGKVPTSGQPTVLQANSSAATQLRNSHSVPDSLAPTLPPLESPRPSAQPVTVLRSPAPEKPEEATDPRGMQAIWLWGSLVSLLLAAGVLSRNWASLSSPGQLMASASNSVGAGVAPTSVPNPPVAPTQAPTDSTPLPPPPPLSVQPSGIPDPAPVETAPVDPATPAPATLDFNPPEAKLAGQVILDRAKKMIQSDQATPYRDAIEEAKKIAPDDALYPDAKAAIQEWSQTIFDIAQRRASQQQVDIAVLAADKIAPDNAELYSQARTLIAQWCPTVRALPSETDSQAQAKVICNSQ